MNALVTITNEKYILGTKVLLHSFLKHHQSYEGDIVVIHHQLPQYLQNRLTNGFNVKFVAVSEELSQKLNDLGNAYPHLSNKKERFWSIELFRLQQYKKILFMDSDILCSGNLNKVLALDHKFSAVADLSFYLGKARDRDSFEYCTLEKKDAFKSIFNAGFMMINLQKIEKQVYTDLLNLLQPHYFKKVTTGHTDQYILNRYFENKVNWLSPKYNYIVRARNLISKNIGVRKEEAVVLHYIRFPKPWNFRKLLKKKLKNREKFAFKEWHKVYLEVLKMENTKKVRYRFMKLLFKLLEG